MTQSSPAEPATERDMVHIRAGAFAMGSADFYPEERPVRRVAVDGVWIDRHQVTNADFARFVEATGYRTLAEQPLDPQLYPGADPAQLQPGSLVNQLGVSSCRESQRWRRHALATWPRSSTTWSIPLALREWLTASPA